VTLAVTSAQIVSIAVTPVNGSMGVGGTQQFTAAGTFTDSSTQDLSAQVTWMSSNANVAQINSAGLANALAEGTANISAAYGGVTGSAQWTVTAFKLTSITIAPDSPTMAFHSKMKFTAMGHFSDGSSTLLTGVTWTSLRPSTASINGSGLLRSKHRQGNVTVKAFLNGVSGSTTITVTNSSITTVVVSPATATVQAGKTQKFTASGYFADQGLPAQDLITSVYWRTDNYTIATVSNSATTVGTATGIKAGTANITATYGSIVSTSVVLTVQ
jgi:Bacterial Ig-like domain (group 2)